LPLVPTTDPLFRPITISASKLKVFRMIVTFFPVDLVFIIFIDFMATPIPTYYHSPIYKLLLFLRLDLFDHIDLFNLKRIVLRIHIATDMIFRVPHEIRLLVLFKFISITISHYDN